jgi:hypothetical protein
MLQGHEVLLTASNFMAFLFVLALIFCGCTSKHSVILLQQPTPSLATDPSLAIEQCLSSRRGTSRTNTPTFSLLKLRFFLFIMAPTMAAAFVSTAVATAAVAAAADGCAAVGVARAQFHLHAVSI